MDLFYPIDTKMNTIELHMTSLWRHKVSAPSKYTWKLAKIKFSLKIAETWNFCRIFSWICKEIMILICIASLKHTSCQIFKEMDKIRVMGFHQPELYHSLWWPPIPKRHPLILSHIHQKMRKGWRNDYTEAFGAVYWGKKNC